MSHTLRSLSLVLCVCAAQLLFAGTCESYVPVNVILPDGKLVRGLKPESLSVAKGQKLTIEALNPDIGARRVLFVVDTGRDLNPDLRKLEAGLVAAVLQSSRPQDSFALMTARGPATEVRFGSAPEKFRDALAIVEKGAGAPQAKFGVMDAVFEGSNWFQQAKPGDAIVAVAFNDRDMKAVSAGKVAETLTTRGIRLFGYLLGVTRKETYDPRLIGGSGVIDSGLREGLVVERGHVVRDATLPNPETLEQLTWTAGGYAVHEPGPAPSKKVAATSEGLVDSNEIWLSYKLTDEKLEQGQKRAMQIYGAIIEYYRLRLARPQTDKRQEWKLELAEPVRKKVPKALVLYPHQLAPCAP